VTGSEKKRRSKQKTKRPIDRGVTDRSRAPDPQVVYFFDAPAAKHPRAEPVDGRGRATSSHQRQIRMQFEIGFAKTKDIQGVLYCSIL